MYLLYMYVRMYAEPVPPKRSPTHYLWAVLIARI